MTIPIRLGTLVVAKRPTAICQVGEIGVCYEIFQCHPGGCGYSFIFERGGYDGFTAQEVAYFLSISHQIDQTTAAYRFTNILALEHDYQAGVFRRAFSTPIFLPAPHPFAAGTR